MGSMLKWISGAGLLGMTLILGGCGSTGSTSATPPPPSPTPGTSNLSVFVKDAAADNVLAFKVDVTSVSVTDSAGHSTTLSTSPMSFELRHLELAPTLALEAGNLTPGAYSTLNLTLANPALVVNTAGTPTQVSNPQLTSTSVSIPLSSFSLPSGGTQGLALDFDLQQSISQNASGNYVITPVIHESAVAPGSSGMHLVDTVGKISALPSSPANSFDFQISNTPSTARIVTDATTVFDASIGKFSSLQVGQYVEVEGVLQNDGTFLAKYIELSASNPLLRIGGVVAAVQKDAAIQLRLIWWYRTSGEHEAHSNNIRNLICGVAGQRSDLAIHSADRQPAAFLYGVDQSGLRLPAQNALANARRSRARLWNLCRLGVGL